MIPISAVSGYDNEVSTHLDVALRVLRNEADAGAGIMATANLLGLGFIPLKRSASISLFRVNTSLQKRSRP